MYVFNIGMSTYVLGQNVSKLVRIYLSYGRRQTGPFLVRHSVYHLTFTLFSVIVRYNFCHVSVITNLPGNLQY